MRDSEDNKEKRASEGVAEVRMETKEYNGKQMRK